MAAQRCPFSYNYVDIIEDALTIYHRYMYFNTRRRNEKLLALYIDVNTDAVWQVNFLYRTPCVYIMFF